MARKLQQLPLDLGREVRSMAWSAAWHAASKTAGNSAEASKSLADLQNSTEAAKDLSSRSAAPISPQTIEDIHGMAWGAAWYTALSRLSSSGASIDCSCPDMHSADIAKAKFDSHAGFLGCSMEIAPKLASNLKWMCWNAAWCAANSKKGFHADSHNDKAQFERRFRCVVGRLLRGVHLGGWLVLERWMCAQAFLGLREVDVPDEVALSSKLSGAERTKHFERWRATWVTQDDFAAIAAAGFNSVRIPFGFWAVEGLEECGADRGALVGPCMELLDAALAWADAQHLLVVLELRGAPGFENNDGSCGSSSRQWQPSDWSASATVEVVRRVAARYRDRKCVTGFSVLGAPSPSIPVQRLIQYYTEAYKAVRAAGMRPFAVSVNFAVHRRHVREFLERNFPPREMDDVLLDITGTLLASPQRQGMTLSQVLRETKLSAEAAVGAAVASGREASIACWNLDVPELNGVGGRSSLGGDWGALSEAHQSAYLRDLCTAQMAAYRKASGWFFFAWKTDPPTRPMSSASGALARGWLPLSAPSDPAMPDVGSLAVSGQPDASCEESRRFGGEEAAVGSESDGDDSNSIML